MQDGGEDRHVGRKALNLAVWQQLRVLPETLLIVREHRPHALLLPIGSVQMGAAVIGHRGQPQGAEFVHRECNVGHSTSHLLVCDVGLPPPLPPLPPPLLGAPRREQLGAHVGDVVDALQECSAHLVRLERHHATVDDPILDGPILVARKQQRVRAAAAEVLGEDSRQLGLLLYLRSRAREG